jgi:hypothetical protein
MKKLIEYIKTKEREDRNHTPAKKANSKEEKTQSGVSREQDSSKPRELFWDGYSDIGYC